MSLNIKPDANHEINEAIAYYEIANAGLGDQFFEELDAELQAILRNPNRCAWIDDRYRRCRLKRFPYSIVYLPVTPPLIVAVHHQSRDPDYWRARERDET